MLTFRAVIGLRFVRGKIIILPIPHPSSFHCRPAANDTAKAQTSWAAPTFASSVGPSNAPPDGRKKAPRLRGFL